MSTGRAKVAHANSPEESSPIRRNTRPFPYNYASYQNNWNYGNAPHLGHTVLGLLALNEGTCRGLSPSTAASARWT